MTRVELIRLIGDVLRQLDTLKASESQPKPALAEVRITLAKQQLKLAISDFDEKAPAFLKASEDILAFNGKLQSVGASDNGAALLDHLTSFVTAVDDLVEGRHSLRHSS